MSDLDKIKEILFGHEKKALDAITRRLETRASRTADVADVLPDAVDRSYRHDPRLKKALREPVEETLSEAIRRDPQEFADVLFPVIGPAIRRAISEALKGLVQSLNRAVDTSLSPSARFKAWRAGVPLGEWVLSQSLLYRVDQVYLIDPDNGLLIEHVSHEDAAAQDDDAVSAMLTAIQDFVRDSFGTDHSGSLDSAALGEYTVWISHGPHAMLAAVIRGTPPSSLRTFLQSTIERLHLQHATALQTFAGEPLPGVDQELEECLQIELRESAKKEAAGGLPLAAHIVLALLAVGLIYWWVSGFLLDRKLAHFDAALRDEPGVLVTQMERRGRVVYAGGLRDPLAADPVGLAAAADLPLAELVLDFRPFQSLDTPIQVARARQVLRPPAGLSLTVEDGRLVASGVAPEAWRERAETVATAIAGITATDFSGVLPDDSELEARLREILKPPASAVIDVTQGRARISGSAPSRWVGELPAALASVAGLRGNETSGLTRTELLDLRRIARTLASEELYFSRATILRAGQEPRLAAVASLMRLFARNARALELAPEFIISGYSDPSGVDADNRELQIARAASIKRLLVSEGVDPEWLFVRGAGAASGGEAADPTMRKAVIQIGTTDLDGRRLTAQ